MQVGLSSDADNGSVFYLDADNINLSASDVINLLANGTINLESKNITIISDNLSINQDGSIESRGGDVRNSIVSIKNGQLVVTDSYGNEMSIDQTGIWTKGDQNYGFSNAGNAIFDSLSVDSIYISGQSIAYMFATKDDIYNALTSYATKSYVSDAISGYATQSDISNALKGYATDSDVSNAISNKVYTFNSKNFFIEYTSVGNINIDKAAGFIPEATLSECGNIASVGYVKSKVSSDERIKKNVIDMPDIEDVYMDIPTYQFEYDDILEREGICYGTTAQAIEKALEKHGLNAEDYNIVGRRAPNPFNGETKHIPKGDYLHYINWDNISGMSMYMIQKLVKRVDELENEIAELKGAVK